VDGKNDRGMKEATHIHTNDLSYR